ncbi:MAG: SDR family NAD(P)-dependent oxidoreductase, partial [Cyanobacteria bacterium Co-bin13]|nr:SDR family NAD(P)-dependent oxidoreductase [Cyanobacteria bacterium Co-bin13]
MNINYHSLLTLVTVAIALLPIFIWLDRRSREQGYDLQGKTILMTGGSRGLGLVMARQLIEAGARLAICARDEAELERAQAELSQQGGNVFSLTCDVTNQAQVEQMVQQARAQL